MVVYEARKLNDRELWHWTQTNNGITICWPPCKPDCNHPTKQEAELHYYNYLMLPANMDTMEMVDEQHKCECKDGCEVMTGYVYGPLDTAFHWLCEQHRTPEEIKKIRPFSPGFRIMSF